MNPAGLPKTGAYSFADGQSLCPVWFCTAKRQKINILLQMVCSYAFQLTLSDGVLLNLSGGGGIGDQCPCA